MTVLGISESAVHVLTFLLLVFSAGYCEYQVRCPLSRVEFLSLANLVIVQSDFFMLL